MSKADDTHFDTYREQTRIKHEILERYLKAYFHILKAFNKRLIYIDGFAGPGRYSINENQEEEGAADGSPVRALRLIADGDGLPERVRCLFVEADAEYSRRLNESVKEFCNGHPAVSVPVVINDTFTAAIDQLMDAVDSLAPTFLFVDPCGVEGVSMEAIKKILANRSCELLLFFNIDGVRRIAGLMNKGVVSPTLVALFGSEARARACADEFFGTDEPDARERIILDHYRRALEEQTGMRFFLRFRVEHETKRITSHYLLHATSHPLGFRIMKDVMWEAGRNPGESEGSLELVQASAEHTATLVRPDLEDLKYKILEHLRASGQECVQVFREVWPERPDDMFSGAVYRRTLLELEREGRIEVVDPASHAVAGPDDRPKRKREPTLASRYLVRLKD